MFVDISATCASISRDVLKHAEIYLPRSLSMCRHMPLNNVQDSYLCCTLVFVLNRPAIQALMIKRTSEADPLGDNSTFIFTCNIKTVSFHHFNLV